MLDVITMGSNTLDLFVHTDQSQMIDIRTREKKTEFITYPVGGKLLVTKLMHNFGGNGTNAAVAFARIGLKAGYVGKVGKDDTGERILNSLKKNKVAFLGARGDESGTSIILDAMGEDRTILTFKGCNNDLKPEELKLPKLSAKWLYISSMLGASLRTMMKVAEYAHNRNCSIAFNPSQTIITNEKEIALNLARLSSLLVLNKEEAEALVGDGSVEENLRKIFRLGPGIVAITDGKNGAVALMQGTLYYIHARSDLKIVETTGAGDAFASTLTAGLMLGKPLDYCLKMAIVQAESVIQGHGAQNNLLEKKALLALVDTDSRKVEQKRG